MKEYNEVLDVMPDYFTSNMFVNKLRKLGVPKNIIQGQNHVGFLMTQCERVTNRTWQKINQETLEPSDEVLEQNCIEFLKLRGYKIMRQVSQYEEV